MVEVGEKAGLMKQRIWQLENSDAYPTLPMLMKVAEGLGCTVVDLIAEPLEIELKSSHIHASAKKKDTDYPCANAETCMFFKKKE